MSKVKQLNREGYADFELGSICVTRGARAHITHADTMAALGRHAWGDWGDVCDEDWKQNELSLREGRRVFSVFHSNSGEKFYVITEADRSVTTILLPQEY